MSDVQRNVRRYSEQTFSNIHSVNELQVKTQELFIQDNFSQLQSSLLDPCQSEFSVNDKMSMPNESIRTSQKNERLFQQNMGLRDKLHQTEDALQDANIKCSLWDKFKLTIQGLNKDYLQLKSIQNSCSDGTILKQFLTVLKDKLEKISISQRIQKSYSEVGKLKDREYYKLYEQQKEQRCEYEQHIITLNSELDILEEENQKLNEKLRNSSLRASDLMSSDRKSVSVSQKQPCEEIKRLKGQYNYVLQHRNRLQEQLEAERERVREIVESLDQYEGQLKKGESEFKRRIKDLQSQLFIQRQIQKNLKVELQEQIIENTRLRSGDRQLLQDAGQHQLSSSNRNQQFQQSVESRRINVLQSEEYLQLLRGSEAIHEKYNRVLEQKEQLGEDKQRLGQRVQELQQLQKQIEFNYEVKIDDTRKHYENQIHSIIANCNFKLQSSKRQHSQLIIRLEAQQLKLLQQLQSMKQQDQDHSSFLNQYQGNILQYKQQISNCQQQLHQKLQLIKLLKDQIMILTYRLQNQSLSQSKVNRIQSVYKENIQQLEGEIKEKKTKEREIYNKLQDMQKLAQIVTSQLNQQNQQNLLQLTEELSRKDDLLKELIQQCDSLRKKAQEKIQPSLQIRGHSIEVQNLINVNQQLRRAFNQVDQNNAILKKNIAELEEKYNTIIADNKNLQLTIQSFKTQLYKYQSQVQPIFNNQLQSEKGNQNEENLSKQFVYLRQNNKSLQTQLQTVKEQLNLQKQRAQTNIQIPLQNTENIQSQNQLIMDDFIHQSSKQQLSTLFQENKQLQEDNTRYHQQIIDSRQEIQDIQRYMKIISDENQKIPHYQQELTQEKQKNQKLKLKIIQQKNNFLTIMQKNQSLYKQLAHKSEKNETLLKENIKVQKEEMLKLHNLINKYYTRCIPSQNLNQRKVEA